MKAYLCIGYLCKYSEYPRSEYIKGHDLQVILKSIIDNYFDASTRFILIDVKDFLCNDNELKELLYILSEFGKRARYKWFCPRSI